MTAEDVRICDGPDCEVELEGGPRQRFCSSTCRSRARRERLAPVPDFEGPLVEVVRKKLIEFGELESFDGHVAVVLAGHVTAGRTGTAGALNALRELMLDMERRYVEANTEDAVARARRTRQEKLAELQGQSDA